MIHHRDARPLLARLAVLGALVLALTACDAQPASRAADPARTDQSTSSDAKLGHLLVQAGEYDQAIDAFTRAALDDGLTAEILMGLGSANIGLGRLGQAETMLREATEKAPEWAEAWNNLGVVLMERDKIPEATLVFRKAYALDNGESDSIRDNLRLALAKSENPDNNIDKKQTYKLVRRGNSDYVIRKVQ